MGRPTSGRFELGQTRVRRSNRRSKNSGTVVNRIRRIRPITKPVLPRNSVTANPNSGTMKKLNPHVKPSIAAYINVTRPSSVPIKVAIPSAVPVARPPSR